MSGEKNFYVKRNPNRRKSVGNKKIEKTGCGFYAGWARA